jgi:aldehyde dehydrogenase (NAD+)
VEREHQPRAHVAPQLKAGVVWINGTNMFDAACGFGGYRESGFGREGGARACSNISRVEAALWRRDQGRRAGRSSRQSAGEPGIDRTAKLYIGGKQVRPDGNYSYAGARTGKGKLVGEVGLGSRKDIRDAVSAARACKAGRRPPPYNRSQVLYFLAENLSGRADEFAARIADLTGVSAKAARVEVELSVERLFLMPAWPTSSRAAPTSRRCAP